MLLLVHEQNQRADSKPGLKLFFFLFKGQGHLGLIAEFKMACNWKSHYKNGISGLGNSPMYILNIPSHFLTF